MFTKTVKVGRRGRGLWFRIPAAIARERNLRAGDEVQFTQIGANEFEVSRVCGVSESVERLFAIELILPSTLARQRAGDSES